jgi:glyoxylase-like metal-dependent hydrolase (beta-lactamase superfamily II)
MRPDLRHDERHVFTGDTLLIQGCGRTDFQSGDAGQLYDSITQKLFTLPDTTIVWPGHDYHGARSPPSAWRRPPTRAWPASRATNSSR